MKTVELLRELSEASGVSGYEDDIREIVRRTMTPWADDIRIDAMGSVIAHKRGERPEGTPARSIMLAAHTDEIGLMITGYEGAFLRFTTVGGVDLRTIMGQEVLVHGRTKLPGIIASRPPHVLTAEERKKPVPLDKLFIDVGMEEDEVKAQVRVGDLVTMRRDLCELSGGYCTGKAMDDRAGVCTLAVCLEELSRSSHSWDVYAVATSQEEVGLKGAMTSAYGIDPDIAIAIDVTFGKQPVIDEYWMLAMDGGPAIAAGPNIHPVLQKRIVETAIKYEIKHQMEYASGATGTDAWAIQVARDGVPTLLLSVPSRYMHTTVETVCIRDIDRTGRLMAQFISGLDSELEAALGLS